MEMDLTCPILDILYNFLGTEYDKAGTSTVRSHQVHAVERFLRLHYKGHNSERRRDPLIRHTFHKQLIIEADPVLNWEERQTVYANLTDKLKRVLLIKRRAHGRGVLSQNFEMLRFRWASFARRFKARPIDNLMGLLYRYTIAKVIWFITTVKSNLGYSVALAVYGPFTYYFITMPMNPHAMQAVGGHQCPTFDPSSGSRQRSGLGEPEYHRCFTNCDGRERELPHHHCRQHDKLRACAPESFDVGRRATSRRDLVERAHG
jgi:hypothetical protein